MQDHRHRLNKDRKGVMSLPIKLMVTMLIITISLPILTDVMDDSQRDMADAEMGQEAERFMNAATLAHRSGEGSSRIVTIDLPAGCELSVGGPESDAYCVRSIYNGEMVSRNYFETPALRITEEMVFTGRVTMKLTSVYTDGIPGVEVTVL